MKKKRHVVTVQEDDFLKWLATKVDRGGQVWNTPIGQKAEMQEPWDNDRAIISGMSFNQDGTVNFIVVEVPPTRALKPV